MNMNEDNDKPATWYEGDDPTSEETSIKEYDITASPNDFNTTTMFSFIESGALKIPGFQRHYVWDHKRASKLIESIIIGLPIPQVFLYEEGRNRFLVIDGQQRLMTLYYFVKGRFPRKEKRIELRRVFDEKGKIPEEILQNDEYFVKFGLQLPETVPGQPNKLHRLNYSTLGELKTTFDLRTIRNVIIKQTSPPDDDSCIYEIFNRLNSGGVNLKPQEIRASLYHSRFYTMVGEQNLLPRWRSLVGLPEPDLHMKDFEILLRGYAMLDGGATYSPSMTKFLNLFSKHAKSWDDAKIGYLRSLFDAFLSASSNLPPKSFYGPVTAKFNISIFEAVFRACCEGAYASQNTNVLAIEPDRLNQLKVDPEFSDATQSDTASKRSVTTRFQRAKAILFPPPAS